jgi:hypothetical protein
MEATMKTKATRITVETHRMLVELQASMRPLAVSITSLIEAAVRDYHYELMAKNAEERR